MKQIAIQEKRMLGLGPPELIIILIIVVLLFGVGRLGRLGGELGKGIREFRRGVSDDDAESKETAEASEEPSE
jgi:sec-independent protein translocase protein TatA